MKIYFDKGNPNAVKILTAAAEVNQKLETQVLQPGELIPEYKEKPRLPLLEFSPGRFLFSANAAANLLLCKGLRFSSQSGEQWLEWEVEELKPVAHAYLASALGSGKSDSGPVKALLKTLDTTLTKQQSFDGADVSCADIVLWSTLSPFFLETSPFKDFRGEFPNLASWFDRLASRKSFQESSSLVFGDNLKASLKSSFTSHACPPDGSKSTAKLFKAQCQVSAPASHSAASPSGESPPEVSVTEEEMSSAKKSFLAGLASVPKRIERKHPILPVEGNRNILVTSALPYVNNVPHLGNIIGCVLSADVFARYCRLRNYNVLYVCGTDEYGTATETKAMEEKMTPKQICDKYNRLHTEIYEWFNIGFDCFGRTTTPQQTEIAQDIFWSLHKNGYILEDIIEQLLCEKCNRFLADRFVEGTCPFCAYEDARGDQCDKCGKLINAVELRNPRCKVCSSSPVIKSSQHLFLDLPKLSSPLDSYLDKEFDRGVFTHNTKVITKAWIRDGLKPRCISRDLKWGTPVPMEGYTDKVFYVWYDAPIGYISITANYTKDWEKWWKNPDQVELFQFMAKDNIPFHSVIFPCTLLGTKQPWTILNNLSATEYLNYEDGKFSKSRGVGVFGSDAQGTGIPADIWRFYLLFLRPESQDSAFSWDDFITKNNSELLNNLGNFINRALMFVSNFFNGEIPAIHLQPDDCELLALVSRELVSYLDNLEKLRLREGIRNILSISRLGNQFMQVNKPWVLVKGSPEEKQRAGSVVGLNANLSCLLSVLIQPYMPAVSKTIQQQLNAPQEVNVLCQNFSQLLPAGHKIGKPSPLFQKIEPSRAAELKKQFAGKQEPVAAQTRTVAASPQEIEELSAKVTKMGEEVRRLKAEKADKSVIDTAVGTLLDLKKQLAQAKGEDAPAPGGGGKKKKGKGGAAPSGDAKKQAEGSAGDAKEVEKLTTEVAKQGDEVRRLKAEKADKGTVDGAVALLLDLKRQLATAQGVDPETLVGGGGGGKNKKKGKRK